MLRIEHCEYFIAIIEAGSISKAAKKLNMSQPYLSQCLKQLESIVGTQLILRTAKGLILTEAGHECLKHSQNIVNEARILFDWQKYSNNREQLKVASFNAYAPINSFYEVTNNSINCIQHQLFEVFNCDVLELVLSRDANLGVIYIESIILSSFIKMLKQRDLAWLPLSQGLMDIVMSKNNPLAQNSSVTVKDITPFTLVFESHKNIRKPLGHIALLEEIDQNTYIKELNRVLSKFTIQEIGFNNMRSLLYYITKNEQVITFGQKRYNRDNPLLKSGELVYLPLMDEKIQLITGIVYPQKLKFSSSEEQFIETLREYISDK